MTIFENLGHLNKKKAKVAATSFIICAVIGICCYFIPSAPFEFIIKGFPQIVGNMFTVMGVGGLVNWFLRNKLCKKYGRYKPFMMIYGVPIAILTTAMVFVPTTLNYGSRRYSFFKGYENTYILSQRQNIEFNKYGEAQNTTQYVIPDGVEVIRSKAFYKCCYLDDIQIPDSVKRIEEKAFHRCSALLSIDLPDNLEFIGKDAFAYCELIESVTIPASIKQIDEYAFLTVTV